MMPEQMVKPPHWQSAHILTVSADNATLSLEQAAEVAPLVQERLNGLLSIAGDSVVATELGMADCIAFTFKNDTTAGQAASVLRTFNVDMTGDRRLQLVAKQVLVTRNIMVVLNYPALVRQFPALCRSIKTAVGEARGPVKVPADFVTKAVLPAIERKVGSISRRLADVHVFDTDPDEWTKLATNGREQDHDLHAAKCAEAQLHEALCHEFSAKLHVNKLKQQTIINERGDVCPAWVQQELTGAELLKLAAEPTTAQVDTIVVIGADGGHHEALADIARRTNPLATPDSGTGTYNVVMVGVTMESVDPELKALVGDRCTLITLDGLDSVKRALHDMPLPQTEATTGTPTTVAITPKQTAGTQRHQPHQGRSRHRHTRQRASFEELEWADMVTDDGYVGDRCLLLTGLCDYWPHCNRGEECWYAHGEDELKPEHYFCDSECD